MNVSFLPEYVLNINAREMRLIGLALTQKLSRVEDVEAAKELNAAMLRQRAAHVAQAHEHTQKVLASAEALASGDKPELSRVVTLIVKDKSLHTAQSDIVDALQAKHATDDPILIVEHPSGERDTIRWPRPNAEHLRSALYDAREMGMIPPVRTVKLPNGETFEID